MVSGSDPLLVEDWLAYEKSMLDVLREDWRGKPKSAPVEPPLSPEELRQLVRGGTVEPGPVESSVADAASQPGIFPLPRARVDLFPLPAALEDEAPSADVVTQPAILSVLREQAEHVPSPTALEDEASSVHALPQAPTILLPEQHSAPAPEPAVMEVVRDYAPPAGTSISPAQPDKRAEPWWRIPLMLSFLAVAVAAFAVVVVKPTRDVNRAPAVTVPQHQPPVEEDSSAAESTIPAPASEPRHSEYEVSGDRVRLRRGPGTNAPVLTTLRQGTAVTIKEHSAQNEWCRLEAAGGLEGWMKCDFLNTVSAQRD